MTKTSRDSHPDRITTRRPWIDHVPRETPLSLAISDDYVDLIDGSTGQVVYSTLRFRNRLGHADPDFVQRAMDFMRRNGYRTLTNIEVRP